MKYLEKFSNMSAYTTAKAGQNFALPHVSLIDATGESMYDPKPFVPQTVTIAGTKWAVCNVGAKKPEETGLYFQWGDTQGYTAAEVGSGSGQKAFSWTDYKYSNGGSSASDMTKYNSTDGKTVLDLSDDAVNAAYGGSWRMPTTAELQALGNAVNADWVSDYQDTGIWGLICTDKTDSSKVLFFPAAGSCYNGDVTGVGVKGNYLSSSLNTSNMKTASILTFNSALGPRWSYTGSRCIGHTVRGVLGE